MSKIQVVWFRDLTRWDTNSNFQTNIKSIHKEIAFGDFLQIPEVEWEILQPEKEYKILGVRSYGLGVYQNRITQGKNLITKTTKKYQKIKPENLFWCKVDTKNGAFGVTSNEHSNFYASHNMIQAKIDTSIINPLFLQYLFACKFFQKFLDSKVTGTTNRQYISFNELKSIKIPLPPLEIQNKIVADIHAIQAKIKALQVEEKRLKDEIEAYIYIALGLQKPQIAKKQKVFVVRFKDLERWDTTHNQGKVKSNKKFQFETLANLATYLQRGKTPIYSNIEKYPVIAQKCVQWNGLELNKALFIEPNSLNAYTQDRLLQDDDILLNSTGLGTLGRVAIYQKSLNPYSLAVADGHITVIRLDKNKILSKFFYFYFASSNIQNTIEEYATGSTKQKELSLALVKQIKIPLPPLEIQKEIVAFVESKTAHISNLAQERSTLQNSIEFKLQKMLVD